MTERDFAVAVMKSIKKQYPGAYVVRPNDRVTIGLPDILAFIPLSASISGFSVALELKSLGRFLDDPMDPGRRTAALLQHPFEGPQVTALLQLEQAGVRAYGLVRVTSSHCFRIGPDQLYALTGNFTHAELVEAGTMISRESDGTWPVWGAYGF
jgi:hypothetical protein